jgi:hypothetical protein
MTLAFNREAAISKIGEFADGTNASAPTARGHGVLADLVTVHPKRQIRLQVLDRVVAGVRVEGIDRVETITAVAAP